MSGLARLLCVLVCALGAQVSAQTVNIGSKRFTESYILGEIVAQTIDHAGEARGVHQQGLGNTAIVFAALKSGGIDVYPEYTGTVAFELLGHKQAMGLPELRAALAPHGIGVAVPLGFNNTYALAVTAQSASALGPKMVSNTARTAAVRSRGWPGSSTRRPSAGKASG